MDTTFVLVCALILFQLYICAVTYWVFHKIDRYENFAFSVIERYLQSRGRGVNSAENTETVHSQVISREHSQICNHGLTPLVNSPERIKLIGYINQINSYAPVRVQKIVSNILPKWYSQLSIDILTLCMHPKIETK